MKLKFYGRFLAFFLVICIVFTSNSIIFANSDFGTDAEIDEIVQKADMILSYVGTDVGTDAHQFKQDKVDDLVAKKADAEALAGSSDGVAVSAAIQAVSDAIDALLSSNKSDGEELTVMAPKSMMSATANAEVYPSSNAIDGSPYTYWLPDWAFNPPNILKINFGRNLLFNKISISPPSRSLTGQWNGRVKKVEIFAGIDENDLKYIGTYTYVADPSEDYPDYYEGEFTINIPETYAKYLQINVIEVCANFVAISDVSVYTYDRGASKLAETYKNALQLFKNADTDQYSVADIADYRQELEDFDGLVASLFATGSNSECYALESAIDAAQKNFLSKRDASRDCDITLVTSPLGAALDNDLKTITFTVPVNITSQVIGVEVKPGAAWKLYSDSACTSEISGSTMSLNPGINSAYIKVTATVLGTTTTCIYTVTIIKDDGNCDIAGVTNPSGAAIIESSVAAVIAASVANAVMSQIIDVEVKPGAVWKLYSDKACTTEISNKTMNLSVGTNTAYIKVTSGMSEKVYAITIIRFEKAYGKSISSMDFGAVPNTGEDMSAKIQSAIDAASFGDTVYVPNGEYVITTLKMKSGIELRGESQDGTVFKFPINAANKYIIDADNTIGAVMKNFTVDAGAKLQLPQVNGMAVSAIRFSGSKNIFLNHLTIKNFPVNSEALYAAVITDAEISECIVKNIGVEPAPRRPDAPVGLYDYLSGGDGCAVRIYGPSYRINFLNNRVEDCGRGGVLTVDKIEDLAIIGNTFIGMGKDVGEGMSIELWYGGDRNIYESMDYTPQRIIIEDNYIDHFISTGGTLYAVRNNIVGTGKIETDRTLTRYCAFESGLYDSVVTGLESNGGNDAGIAESYGERVVYANSTYKNNAQWGMQAALGDGSSTKNMEKYFYNVNFIDNPYTNYALYDGYQGKGVRFQQNCQYYTFDSCNISNNGAEAFEIWGYLPDQNKYHYNDYLSIENCAIENNAGPAFVINGWLTGFEVVNTLIQGNGDNSIPNADKHTGFATRRPDSGMIIPATAVVGQPIEFKSDATAYDGATITNYLWDFGEGVPVTTRDAIYSYTKPGTYKVMLTVWDSNQRGHLCEKEIVVSPSPTQAAGVDVRELERLIALAETMLAQNPGYPEYNKNRLSAAIAEAAGYLTSVNQSEVDGICEYLFKEIVNFEKKVMVMDKSELEELLLVAKAVDQNKYTADSVKPLLEAIALGESVLNNGAATESDLAAATAALSAAIKGLVPLPVAALVSVSVETQPKLAYTELDTLDLSGLRVTLNYSGGMTKTVGYADFAANGITLAYSNGKAAAQGDVLKTAIHNGLVIVITCGGFTAKTGALSVKINSKYDINGDGKVDASDLALIMSNLNKKASTNAVTKKCDLDGDGVVTMADYNMLAAYIAEIAKA